MDQTTATIQDEARLRVLASFDVLDQPPPVAFEHVVQVASALCGSRIALISLVDRERLYFMASAGLDVQQVPNERSLCSYATLFSSELLEVEDASRDPRFADSPLVTGPPGIRFYAGAPLVSAEGAVLGTLCVIDRAPRQLNETQRVALASLAEVTMQLLEARRRELQLQQQLSDLAPPLA